MPEWLALGKGERKENVTAICDMYNLDAMISDSDIYRSAQVMRREHGDEALALSQARANKHRDAGDDDGAAVWMRIAKAIVELQRVVPEGGEATH